MTDGRLRVLILGGYGTFGGWLVAEGQALAEGPAPLTRTYADRDAKRRFASSDAGI